MLALQFVVFPQHKGNTESCKRNCFTTRHPQCYWNQWMLLIQQIIIDFCFHTTIKSSSALYYISFCKPQFLYFLWWRLPLKRSASYLCDSNLIPDNLISMISNFRTTFPVDISPLWNSVTNIRGGWTQLKQLTPVCEVVYTFALKIG